MSISLIANSGIQFHKFKLTINPNDDVIKTLAFYEYFNEIKVDISLEYAYKIPNTDSYAAKSLLKSEDYLDENDNFKTEVNFNTISTLPQMEKGSDITSGYYKINDIEECLKYYENIWLPFPYFKKFDNNKSDFGPYAWCRIFLKNITPKENKVGKKNYEVILAFDTTIQKEKGLPYFIPRETDTNSTNNTFKPSNNEDYNLNFCNEEYNCGWVKDYIREIRIEGELPNLFAEKHLAEYLYLIKYLSELEPYYLRKKSEKESEYKNAKNIDKKNTIEGEIKEIEYLLENGVFPEVKLYTDKIPSIDVDLVLDIGNANTCGLLFESPSDTTSDFNFNSVKKLEIIDLSENVGDIHKDPFSMRLAFAKAEFGNIDIPEFQKSFKWPSLIRVGKEAQRLINQYNIDSKKGSETATNNSSPKRYLWDNKKTEIPWEFVNLPIKRKFNNVDDIPDLEIFNANQEAYFEGISEQFKGDGEYTFDTNSAVKPNYSRKSLMTFVYIEIFLNALRQINSHDFRSENAGGVEKPRKLKRITITCPTSIVQKEQIILRQCALDAARALKRFYTETYGKSIDEKEIEVDFKIIPSPKDLKMDLSETRSGEREDWIYDEATCSQLVFLYAEVSKRYLNNSETFFNLYGKKRADVEESYQKSVTIGSIDIGGGTTDLMIAAYEYAEGTAVLKPKPLYWESFSLAGDDLLKEIVKQVVLEGNIEKEEEKGCKGVIKNYAEEMKCGSVKEKMQNFFGTDSNKQGYITRIFRKNFNIQIAIPIAMKYLEHASNPNANDNEEVGFDYFFKEIKPNPNLIKYVNEHFGKGFNLEDTRWKLSKKRVFDIIDKTFDALFKQLSMILSAYGSDFLLLSGKPTDISRIREIFIKYYPVSPDRIISLNSYRVGRWYPNFGSEPDKGDLGYFKDSKTIVAVGAIIALMAGKLDKLGAFKINTELLTKDLLPTTDYIGIFDVYTKDVRQVFFTPEQNSYTFNLNGLPMILGYKQLSNDTYPGRPIYKLEFNERYLREKVTTGNNSVSNEIEILDAIEYEKEKVKRNMPLKISLKRMYRNSKEEIEIISIKDKQREDLSERILSLSLMTLPEEEGYWLDTGEFILSI